MTTLEKALKRGLQEAAGKTISEAVEIMVKYIEIAIDIPDDRTPARVTPPPVVQEVYTSPAPVSGTFTAPTPQAAIAPPPPITDLAPIDGGEAPAKKVRNYRDLQAIEQQVLAGSPSEVKVTINGSEIVLSRVISQVTGECPGIILGFMPRQAGPDVAYPKYSFWSTDEVLDVAAAMDWIKDQAVKMYTPQRTAPLRTNPRPPNNDMFGIRTEAD